MSAARIALVALCLLLAASPVIAYFAWLGPLLVGSGFRRHAALCLVGAVVCSGLVLRWLPVRGSAT